jgi:hypothetical protein
MVHTLCKMATWANNHSPHFTLMLHSFNQENDEPKLTNMPNFHESPLFTSVVFHIAIPLSNNRWAQPDSQPPTGWVSTKHMSANTRTKIVGIAHEYVSTQIYYCKIKVIISTRFQKQY